MKYKPQSEFPYFEKACKLFTIKDTTCFTYGDTYYTNFTPLSPDLMVHERHHTTQQMAMTPEVWWDKFFNDPKFRVDQEIECYKRQLASIKDREHRFRVKLHTINTLSSDMYGNCITKEEVALLLK